MLSAKAGQETILLATVAGLASHQYFRKYEPTISSFLTFLLCLQCLVYIGLGFRNGQTQIPWLAAIPLGALFGGTFLVVLGLSITMYRVFFHPLRNFPGPVFSRISKWQWFFRIRAGHDYLRQVELHKKVSISPDPASYSPY